MTGNRHPFQNDWKVGFDDDGVIQALDFDLYSDGGAYADLSTSIMERAIFWQTMRIIYQMWRFAEHRLNQYSPQHGIPRIWWTARYCNHWICIGRHCSASRNRFLFGSAALFYGVEERNTTHYEQKLDNNTLPELFEKLYESSEYQRRRDEIDAYNQSSLIDIRGLSMVVKVWNLLYLSIFGIKQRTGQSPHRWHSAGVHRWNRNGAIHVKIRHVVMRLGISDEDVMVLATSTDKNHNTSPTAVWVGPISLAAAEIALNQIIDRIKISLLKCRPTRRA